METTFEQYFACPYCGEEIAVLLDTSLGGQAYVEDCQVCCNPIEIAFEAPAGEVTSFEARRIDE